MEFGFLSDILESWPPRSRAMRINSPNFRRAMGLTVLDCFDTCSRLL